MTMNRIFSGVQPTGNLHLGNYLGAIRNWVGMQSDYQCIFCIVDLHAITTPQDPKALRNSTRETAAAYIACGIDPETSIIFPQSAVSGHAELSWILGCHTPLGWLNRMTQFKEKAQSSKKGIEVAIKEIKECETAIRRILSKKDLYPSGALNKLDIIKDNLIEIVDNLSKSDSANLGLYAYPTLMAADILLYKATHVPVGEDQKQHIELARDIAGAFNRAYKQEVFPLPEPMIMKEAARIMSLRDGTKKMSKSDESDYSRINLTDTPEDIAKKFKKAKSDSIAGITYNPEERPEASNLITIYAALKNVSRETLMPELEQMNFASFKSELADLAVEKLEPVTTKMRELMEDEWYLDNILRNGTQKAKDIASDHMKEIKELVGFFN